MAIVKKQIKKKVYSVLKDVGANDKCPPQARLIVDTIKTAGGKIEREELLTLLKHPPEQGGLKTNQTAERILGFYKPKLTEMGVLQEATETEEIEVEVPDTPVKADAPAAAAGRAGSRPPAGNQVAGYLNRREQVRIVVRVRLGVKLLHPLRQLLRVRTPRLVAVLLLLLDG